MASRFLVAPAKTFKTPANREGRAGTLCAYFAIMNTKVKTVPCLFFSRRGELAVHLIEPPVPEVYQTPEVPPGMLHAVRVLGLSDRIRVFQRTAEDGVPVYEEV